MSQSSDPLSQALRELDQLRGRAEAAFSQVAEQHPGQVACRPGCDDCCHALFDLAPIEALALARSFLDLPRATRREAARRGAKASQAFDRAVAQALGQQGRERLRILSQARVACPLLKDSRCLLYAQRPVTCRLYGVPTAIEGQARICRLAGFQPGQSYPTVDLGRINAELERQSTRALAALPELGRLGRLDMGRALELAESQGELLRRLMP